jgi:hypothetical protein
MLEKDDRRRMNNRLVATALLSVALSGCGNGIKTVDLPRTTSSPRLAQSLPAGDARIEITSPKDGSTIRGGDVTVVVDVNGFDLVGDRSKPRVGAGHIVYYYGSLFEVPVAPDRPATAGGRGTFVSYASTQQRYGWTPPAGMQTFAVQLVSSDNLPLDPPRLDMVTVTVER